MCALSRRQERHFPNEMRRRLRTYFIFARGLLKESRFVHITNALSPALRAECAETANKVRDRDDVLRQEWGALPTTNVTVVCSPNNQPWLDRVWYFHSGCSASSITEISCALEDAVYAQV